MEIKAERRTFTDLSTISDVFIDGRRQCLFLEDKVREVPGVPIEKWKVPEKTAIPFGRYRILFTYSKRFQRVTPQIINVPGFAGVRIHGGNKPEDTEGCPLTGYEEHKDEVLRSQDALKDFVGVIHPAFVRGEDIWIEFVDGRVS